MNTSLLIAAIDFSTVYLPLIAAGVGVATVLILMLGFRINAFLALITAAIVVAVIAGIGGMDPMNDVSKALGSTAGSVAILIAMASIVGKCMLDNGSADVIVTTAVRATGERRAPVALMGSGFLLSIPVFFDTVFYLLVPLARSLYQKTRQNYVLYIMAIACGGAITHTLVPPTPGPLLVVATLGADIGMVMLIGILVAIFAALGGLAFCYFMNSRMTIPMRPVGGVAVDSPDNDGDDLTPEEHPLRTVPLWLALLPVLLPIVMISISTIATTIADNEDRAKLSLADLRTNDQGGPSDLQMLLTAQDVAAVSPASRIAVSSKLTPAQQASLLDTQTSPEQFVVLMNRVLLDSAFYSTDAFNTIAIPEKLRAKLLADQLRTKPGDMRHMNRQLLELVYPELVAKHEWQSPARKWSDWLSSLGNASLALSISALIAIMTLAWAKSRSMTALAGDIEEALMSGGLIILITAAGGAFGAMLQQAHISEAIKELVDLRGSGGLIVMVLGFAIASALKVAQGSSTVAMIIGASMVAAMVDVESLPYHAGYLVTSIGGGSLVGSWMNDSGFWVYSKMTGLTEAESLKTWTPLLAILGTTSLIASLVLATILPLM